MHTNSDPSYITQLERELVRSYDRIANLKERTNMNIRRHVKYTDIVWAGHDPDQWTYATVVLAKGETAWMPGTTKHVFYGPLTIRYERAPDGGCSASPEDA